LTKAESSVGPSGFHFCIESQVWSIKEDISGYREREREKTGLTDLTRLIREDAIDLSTLLYTVVINKKKKKKNN